MNYLKYRVKIDRVVKLLLLQFLSLAVGNVTLAQTGMYRITEDEKGKFSLTNTVTGTVIFSKCTSINPVSGLSGNTDPAYQDYLAIRKGKTFILFDTQRDTKAMQAECEDIEFAELQDDYHGMDSIVPKKSVIVVRFTEKERFLKILLNVKTGKTIALTMYNTTFNHDRTLVKIQSGPKTEIRNLDGKVIVPMMEVMNELPGAFIVRESKAKYGVISRNGEIQVPFIYQHLEPAFDNYLFAHDTHNKSGVIDLRNRVVIPFDYKVAMGKDLYSGYYFPENIHTSHGVFVLLNSLQEGDFVIVDTTRTVILPAGTYMNIASFTPGKPARYFETTSKAGLKGIYDTKLKKELFPCEYTSFGKPLTQKENLHFLQKGLLPALKNGSWGLLNLATGKVQIPFEYEPESVQYIGKGSYFLLKKDGRTGAIAITGKELVPFQYDKVEALTDEVIKVKNRGLYGLVNINTFKEVVPCEYSSIDHGYRKKNIPGSDRAELFSCIKIEKIEGTIIKRGCVTSDGIITWDE